MQYIGVVSSGTITTADLGGDITTAGKAILDDADNTAQRSTLGAAADVSTQTIWIPASAMTVPLTSPPALILSTTNFVYKALYFDGISNIEYANFITKFPKGWNKSSLSAKIIWMASNANAGNVKWSIAASSVTDAELLTNTTFTSTSSVVDGTPVTNNVLSITSLITSITVTNSPADDDLIVFKISRDPTDASDTYGYDAKLLGISLFYNTTSLNDA